MPQAAPASAANAVSSIHAASLSPAMETALGYLEGEGASDLLLSSGHGVRVRIGGELHAVDHSLTEADVLSLLSAMPAADEELAARGSCDFALDLRTQGGRRYRVNLFRQQHGVSAALRSLRDSAPTLRQLQLPESLADLARLPHGLVLVTGQSGAGKSTTLVALVEELNRTSSRHVITLEDPIEYEYAPRRALIHQREVGTHLESFAEGLRAALRESPDVILVGEMRDAETIAAALTAAETGHLVLSTLHAASAEMALDRIIDSFPEAQQRQVRVQLACVLRAVFTQFLLPCRTSPTRVPAYELLLVNSAVSAMIREDKCHQIPSQIQTGRDSGMIPLDRVLAQLLRDRRIEAAVARTIAREPDRL
jgi:twitching motility protein PilT